MSTQEIMYYGVMFAGLFGLAGMMFGETKKPFLGLAMGAAWGLIFIYSDQKVAEAALHSASADTFEVVTFFMLVMIIIEGGVHYGMMNAVLRLINTSRKRTLMFIVGAMSFCLSAVLDNLTAAIVMSVLLVQLMSSPKNRLMFICIIIAGANAGGVPSAIGNTTSILLWVGGQLTIEHMFIKLILPAIAYMATIFGWFWFKMDGEVERPVPDVLDPDVLEQSIKFKLLEWEQWGILCLVLTCILIVIVLKVAFHLPPMVGGAISFGLWGLLTNRINSMKGDHFTKERNVRSAIHHIDHSTIIMFTLMLPLVSAVGFVGALDDLATQIILVITNIFGEAYLVPGVAIVMGLISSVVPNTPLVAASQVMFDYETNHLFWQMLNYTTGVGGNLLPLGTAAGVVLASRFRELLTISSYVKTAFIPLFLAFWVGLGVMYAQSFLF